MRCEFCGKENVDFAQECLVVEYNDSLEWDPDDRRKPVVDHSYRCTGKAVTAGLCPECLKKFKRANADSLVSASAQRLIMAGGFVFVVLLEWLMFHISDMYRVPDAFVICWVAAEIIILGVILHIPLFITRRLMHGKTGMLLAGAARRGSATISGFEILVPVGFMYYKNYRHFRHVNNSLPKEFCRNLYEGLIDSGDWEDAVLNWPEEPERSRLKQERRKHSACPWTVK